MFVSVKPLISVIIPVYNVAPYLRHCLDTVINQTYKNLEIVIVASISKDNSVDICEEYAEKDTRITLIHTEPNGLSAARNRGIDVSHGEYLCFIDSDDYIHPDFISTLYSICFEYGCDISQCGFARVNTEYNEFISDSKKGVKLYSGREMSYNLYYNVSDATVNTVTWSKLYNRKLFSNIRFPVGKIHEDVATTYKLIYSSKLVGVSTKNLYFYRVVPTSITGIGFTLKSLDRLQFLEERVEFFRVRGEIKLSSLWHLYCVKSYGEYLINLKKYFPHELDLWDKLREKYTVEFSKVLEDTNIPLIDKIIMIIRFYFPRITTILGKIVQINKIRQLFFQRDIL